MSQYTPGLKASHIPTTGMCVYTQPTEKALIAETYRDKDGLIKQLLWRVKHIEEKSLLVQGKRETSECLLTTRPGRGSATTHSLRVWSTQKVWSELSPALSSGDLIDSGMSLP